MGSARSQSKLEFQSRVIVGSCVALVACCLGFLLLLRPGAATAAPEPSATTRAAAPGPVASVIQTESIARRVRADSGAFVTFQVVGTTAEPLDAVRFRFGAIARSVALESLIELGVTSSGRITLPLSRLETKDGDEGLLLTTTGYLPLTVPPPAEAGVYVLSMTRGRVINVRIVDSTGAPVPEAQVTFFSGNVDANLLARSGRDGRRCDWVVGCGNAWFASVSCDMEGRAMATVPNGGSITVVASGLGWFPVAGPQKIVEDYDTKHTMELRLAPVRCAVLASRPSKILGKSFCALDLRLWREATNISAFAARDAVREILVERFPGDLVIVECLEARTASAPSGVSPQARLRILIDGQGEADVAVALEPFKEVRLSPIERREPDGRAALGWLSLAAVAGYDAGWDPPLYASLESDAKTRIWFDLPYGVTHCVPAGRYQVYQRRLGGASETKVGSFEVTPGQTCRVEVGEGVRWPIVLRVMDERSASPRFCSVRIRRQDTKEEWRVSPSNPAHFEGYLEEGAYEVFASSDRNTWQRTRMSVLRERNRFNVAVEW